MTCPICGKPAAETYRPFCSKRCADLDLGHWLTGTYSTPAVTDDISDDDPIPLAIPASENE